MEFFELIKERRSIRDFKDIEVNDDLIKKVIEAGMYAPTGTNSQDTYFTAIKNKELLEELRFIGNKILTRQNFFYNPNVLILVSYGPKAKTGLSDVSCAMENMMLAATDLGLSSVWINQLLDNENQLLKEFYKKIQIPEDHKVCVALALGYPNQSPRDITRNLTNYRIIK